MKPAFSVILPIYNVEKTLLETLNSISGQDYKNFELIAVNDGSTDRSILILQQWHEQNPHIRLSRLNQKNQGLGAARNTGVNRANYAWIAFIDADDLWKPAKLSAIAEAIGNKPADIYYHRVETFGNGKIRQRKAYQLNSLEELLLKGNPIIPSAVAGPQKVFAENPFLENKDLYAEDLHLWIRLLSQQKRFSFIDKPLTSYRETGGISTSNLEKHLKDVFSVLEYFADQGLYDHDILIQAKRRKLYEAGRFYHKLGRFSTADSYYEEAGTTSLKALVLKFMSLFKIRL